ncbi:DUF4249 domain-containing protein [Fibrella arboris]|uniref:DUF4249 domain-containing protein n=1 Tax=Fibrella arboris TaxID=3242486 RepID=UPI003520C9BF
MNRHVFRYVLHLFIYGLLVSCVTPYQPETKSLAAKALIVDGFITDQPGPHQVTLSYSADYTSTAINFIVTGALVYVSDDQGKRQDLVDIGKGVYRTPATFQGQQGRTYKLFISLPDGRKYESKPETITPAPPIDRIYEEYTTKPIAGTKSIDKGFNVYLDTKDPATTGNYYRWIWTHFEPLTLCEIRTVTTRGVSNEYGYTCCQDCWDVIRCAGGNCNNLASDEQINGNAISRQFLLRAPYTSNTGYYIEVEQLSVSRDAYQYYKTIENLTSTNGGIFDAAPASLRGNIVSVTNPGETVFGYFSASGSQKVPHVVDRTKGDGSPNFIILPPPPPQPPLPPCSACVESDGRTRVKPRWWPY